MIGTSTCKVTFLRASLVWKTPVIFDVLDWLVICHAPMNFPAGADCNAHKALTACSPDLNLRLDTVNVFWVCVIHV